LLTPARRLLFVFFRRPTLAFIQSRCRRLSVYHIHRPLILVNLIFIIKHGQVLFLLAPQLLELLFVLCARCHLAGDFDRDAPLVAGTCFYRRLSPVFPVFIDIDRRRWFQSLGDGMFDEPDCGGLVDS
jgi:hypothetical protein